MQQLVELITQLNPFDLIQVIFWGLAGGISFYFSLGNARVWTSISIGFFLIFLGQAYAINPFVAGVYAGAPSRLSVQHAFPKLHALEQRGGS